MKHITRKDFIKLSALLGGAVFGSTEMLAKAAAKGKKTSTKAKVVVIGGGFGGATCSKYIKKMDSGIDVTLVEKEQKYITCPMSNTVIGGVHNMGYITHTWEGLKKYGVNVVHDTAVKIDPVKKTVNLKSGKVLKYDKLVVSPGIEFIYEGVEGYSEKAAQKMPHAWKAGAQTTILANQLKAMPANGTVIIAPPDNPFRCPPGPYERAGMIAHFMKEHKPDGKILILDAKETFAKKDLFVKGWETLYLDMIEFVPGSKGGKVERVDANKMEVVTSSGTHKGAVINLIPPQKAGMIAHQTGLAKGNWCPVNQATFESELHKDVYVIGDAAMAGPMPKSGFSANSHGKVCATAIVASVNGINMPDPSYANTCYSFVSPDYGISVAAVYNYNGKEIAAVPGSGGVSPMEADFEFRKKEAEYAAGWYDSIIKDTLR